MHARRLPREAMGEARVLDPASRDQDAEAWRRGRFAERVRREWNPLRTPAIEACRLGEGYDLEILSADIQEGVGGDPERILARLALFWAAEEEGRPAGGDPLVRPGSN